MMTKQVGAVFLYNCTVIVTLVDSYSKNEWGKQAVQCCFRMTTESVFFLTSSSLLQSHNKM